MMNNTLLCDHLRHYDSLTKIVGNDRQKTLTGKIIAINRGLRVVVEMLLLSSEMTRTRDYQSSVCIKPTKCISHLEFPYHTIVVNAPIEEYLECR